MTDERPDPDALLAQVTALEAARKRGRLRIYFGASAGVGKTFAMLNAAHALRREGRDVVVGLVETHGRRDTDALLAGLEVVPRRTFEYQGQALPEFDLDAVLARRPALVLVDELAHSNVPGTRHPKRWQDVDELLAAGIDVFTTLNVQHLDSLNDVVGGITGVTVRETVPDAFFDRADEVVMVDVSADDLLARLAAGQVYLPEQAERAARNFFRKGNLMALRELALRRTADRVEDDVRTYRADQAIERVWKTDDTLLCCIGPDPGDENVVRSAARLATGLGVPWTAVYVETPALQRLASRERERILLAVRLAQDLGATTAIVAGADVAQALVAYAREHNCARLMVGRARIPAWRVWQRGMASRIGSLAPDVDIVEVGRAAAAPSSGRPEDDPVRSGAKRLRYAWATLACLGVTLLAWAVSDVLDAANIVMLYLLGVVVVALRWGRGPAVLAAFVSVAAYDFFFVPPSFSFAVSDVQYVLTFGVMLVVALVIGQMTAGVRYQARVAAYREERARSLYEFARELSSLLVTHDVSAAATRGIGRTFHARSAVLVAGEDDRLTLPLPRDDAPVIDTGAAQWAFDKGLPAGRGTDTLPGSASLYLPLQAPMRIRGVLVVEPAQARSLLVPEQRRHLDTFALLIAIALERVHYVEVAQKALVQMESERLRNSLLAALSHDLRTPIAALQGLSETLAMASPPLPPAQEELTQAMADEARRMSSLVTNLLDMARLSSGEVRLHKRWQPIEEVVGSALDAARRVLEPRRVRIDVPADLPLVEFDAVLMERVLFNLLENAAKYTAGTATIEIAARATGSDLVLCVRDDGPGLPPGQEDAIFEKFARGARESATRGVGLGLAIARAIVEAHGGRISAAQAAGGGAIFTLALPLGHPPDMPTEQAEQEKAA